MDPTSGPAMNIGILTYGEENNNAGALLQAYGLQETLREMGHRPEVIRYPVHRDRRHLRILWSRIRKQGHARELVESYWRYERFRRTCLFRSPPCRDGDELRQVVRRYDVLITGSDQVWNTQMGYRAFQKRPDFGFLSFADGLPVRKVAYAACSGVPTADAASFAYVPYWLRQLDAISVRNRATQSLVAQWLDGTEVPVVCDPTYFNDFSRFKPGVPRGVPEDYILVYAFPSTDQSLGEAILRRMREETRLPVVVIPPADFQVYDFPGADHYVRTTGPGEWIALLANARAFLTNSFHGMAIASQFEIPFAAYTHPGTSIAYRLDDIAERYGLAAHLVTSPADVPTVAWAADEDRLRQSRERILAHVAESRRFLAQALKGA